LKYIANCTIHESNRTYQKGKDVSHLPKERLEKMKHLPGWAGEKMVVEIEDKSMQQAPENKVIETKEEETKSGKKPAKKRSKGKK
jgi:hypothetical protein